MPPFLAIATFAALAYGFLYTSRDRAPSWPASALKTASTGFLAAYAFGLHAPFLITLGLVFGCIGDFALSRPGKPAFLAGMAAFALGHAAYVVVFWHGYGPGLSLAQSAGLTATLALVVWTVVWLAPRTGALCLPIRAYGLIIGAMAALAVLRAPGPGTCTTQIGAALFLASDTLLALRLFVAHAPAAQRLLSITLWPAYWIGQYLILRGALLFTG